MKRLLMAGLLLSALTTMCTAQASNLLSKTEEMLSSIEPDLWYPGSDVRDGLRHLLALALDESASTTRAAVTAAVTPAVEAVRAESAARGRAEAERDGWALATAGAGACAGVLAVILAVLVIIRVL